MNENIYQFFKKSEEDIEIAGVLINRKNYRVAVSRLYYALFYIAEALLLTKELAYSSHKGVISNFGREFVKSGLFDNKFHKVLRDAFKSRQDADYEPVVEFTREEAENYLILAREFLEEAKRYLKKGK